MVDGVHVQGKGLPGATVTIQGGNSYNVQRQDGAFSFSIPSETYLVQSVQKKGYELVDADEIIKPHHYSTDSLFLVMETPEQQLEDLLEAEEKISRTLRASLQKSQAEIKRLKEKNLITQQEYEARMQQLLKEQQNNKKLVEEMAKQYVQMDYDQMDALNRRISDAILSGRLTEADTLLRSKGDMKSRDQEIDRRLQAETQREKELFQEQEQLTLSKTGTQKLLEDFGEDCLKYHNMFKLENKHDSAMYYIELRARRDTTNAEWQNDAGDYCQEQNLFEKAENYYIRALARNRIMAQSVPTSYDSDLAKTLYNLASVYNNPPNLFSDSLSSKHFFVSEGLFFESLKIFRRLALDNPDRFKIHLAHALNGLAILYYYNHQYANSERFHLEALDIYRQLAKNDPAAYESDLAASLDNLANLYYDTQRFTESERMHTEALEILRKLVTTAPTDNEPDLAMNLYNMGELYNGMQRFIDSEKMYSEALEIYRRFAKNNPAAYEPKLAFTLGGLSNNTLFLKDFSRAEKYALEGLEVDSTQHWIICNLAVALLLQGKDTKADTLYREYKDELRNDFLNDFQLLENERVIPKERKKDVERVRKMLNE